ncbi:MAG: IS6 family transposase [Clostridia bacterium]|nr:IS6 family transposase [Clostridia bacterium]
MKKLYQISCPKCNNNHSFYRYGKDSDGYQKYFCRKCHHQFAPERPRTEGANQRKYPPCPVCGKASFLHHDYENYSNYRCGDKKCNHSFFEWKSTAISAPSMSELFGKHNFKRMRYPAQIIFTALSMFFLGKNSYRNISLILQTAFNIKVSHTTISNWCVKFAPMFDDMRIQLMPLLNFDSDEWHADETVVKIAGVKHYIWFIIDSETRFVIGFHLSPHRDSLQAVSLFNEARKHGKPSAIVSDRYSAYKIPTKSIFEGAKHIRVQSFKDDISNNLIECFNKQFKAWYKTKQGFSSFRSANNLISVFVFFFNFVRPHSALNELTPAQVAGLSLSKKSKREFPLVA